MDLGFSSEMAWVPLEQIQQQQQQLQIQQQQQQQQQQLASQFYLFPLLEAIADAAERGIRDQQVDELVNELGIRFERCNQLLAPYVQTSAKPMTLRSQKLKLQEYEHQLNLRREALAKYKAMVEKAAGGGGVGSRS